MTQLSKQEIIALADALTRAVRECRDILIKSIERQEQEPPERPFVILEEPPAPLPEFLTTMAAVAYLRDVVGYPISKSLMEKVRGSGGGPPYRTFGTRIVYTPADLRAWAEGRSRRRTSTSDPGTRV